ncbi:hypothetical protein MMPV_004336 [Pyropia vietnamensis]
MVVEPPSLTVPDVGSGGGDSVDGSGGDSGGVSADGCAGGGGGGGGDAIADGNAGSGGGGGGKPTARGLPASPYGTAGVAPVVTSTFSHRGVTVTTTRGGILDSAAEARLSSALGIKLPGMVFGRSSLTLAFAPPPTSSATAAAAALTGNAAGTSSPTLIGGGAPPAHPPPVLTISFNAADALAGVGSPDPHLRVAAARSWSSSRPDPPPPPPGASDWTFTTRYAGTLGGSGDRDAPPPVPRPAGPGEGVDMAALRRTDVPILYYDEVRLFDDEVDDHGIVSATVRVRVMDACVFVLSRIGIRVDGVLWRVLDTRVYHAFGAGKGPYRGD